jgi:ABC-type glycerol-3-phosphate transport system substrate-binding protein
MKGKPPRMKRKWFAALFCSLLLALLAAGCYGARTHKSDAVTVTQNEPSPSPTPAVTMELPALPEQGFKARIRLDKPPTRMTAGEKRTLKVRVRNVSEVAWPAKKSEELKGVVAVSNSWLDKDGNLLTNLDGRMGIVKGLAPNSEIEVSLTITAPKEPGNYILELDMVQELVAFFKEKGNETLKVKVKVE